MQARELAETTAREERRKAEALRNVENIGDIDSKVQALLDRGEFHKREAQAALARKQQAEIDVSGCSSRVDAAPRASSAHCGTDLLGVLHTSRLQAANAAKAHEEAQSVSQRLSSWWRGEGATVTAVADAKGVVSGRGTGMGCSAHRLHEHGHRVSA